jgi:hypothetical protein
VTVLYSLYYDNGPNEEKVEKEGGKKKMIMVKLRMDLHREEQQEVMEISSEEEEKKTKTFLSSNEIRQEAKASVIG